MTNQQELYDRINFWRKQNNEKQMEPSFLSQFSIIALESILNMQYNIFIHSQEK